MSSPSHYRPSPLFNAIKAFARVELSDGKTLAHFLERVNRDADFGNHFRTTQHLQETAPFQKGNSIENWVATAPLLSNRISFLEAEGDREDPAPEKIKSTEKIIRDAPAILDITRKRLLIVRERLEKQNTEMAHDYSPALASKIEDIEHARGEFQRLWKPIDDTDATECMESPGNPPQKLPLNGAIQALLIDRYGLDEQDFRSLRAGTWQITPEAARAHHTKHLARITQDIALLDETLQKFHEIVGPHLKARGRDELRL